MKNPQATTAGLLLDLDRRDHGWTAVDRVELLSNVLQKSAFICLAGILPLGAIREYSRGREEGIRDPITLDERGKKQSGEGIPNGMDLSTLQDLVSGVGVILGSDFSLPRGGTNAARQEVRSGRDIL